MEKKFIISITGYISGLEHDKTLILCKYDFLGSINTNYKYCNT